MITQCTTDLIADQDSASPLAPQCLNQKKEKTSSGTNKRIGKKKKAKMGRKKERATFGEGFKSSLWTLTENIAYMQYLKENEQLFYTSRLERKTMKINVLMSEAIRTRSADQCRSHHQKMIKYHSDIPNIIAHIRGLIQKEEQAKSEPLPALQDRLPAASPRTLEEESSSIPMPEMILPGGDWQSWISRNELAEQERLIEVWLDGVEDKYGNL